MAKHIHVHGAVVGAAVDSLLKPKTTDGQFRLTDMDGHDWGTWTASNLEDALRQLRADVARRPSAYLGRPNIESIRKSVRIGGSDASPNMSGWFGQDMKRIAQEFVNEGRSENDFISYIATRWKASTAEQAAARELFRATKKTT